MAKTSRNLKPESTIAAELAMEAQKAARESNSASITAAVRTVIGELHAAETAIQTAKDAAQTKLEGAYVSLAKLAHENELGEAMCKDILTQAIDAFYGEGQSAIAVSTAGKLRTQLLRAMHPNVRFQVAAIMAPWQAAWNAETAAKAADKNAATPLRDKFDNRGGLVTQALKNARGADGNAKTGKGKVAPETCAAPDAVLEWVRAHPRQPRGTASTTAATAKAETTTAVAALPKDAKPREIATARVTGLINAVQDVAKDYPAATALFADVLAALRLCTGDKLLPSTLAEQAADKPLIPPAEPVAGAAELDDALIAEFEAFQAFQAMRAKTAK